MVVESNVPVESGTPTSDPGSSSPGQSSTQPTVAPSQNIPENLRGKTPEQLAEMYTHLEKKLGEQSSEVSTTRKMKEDMQIVLQAIGSDPEIYRKVERRVAELQGGALPETREPGKGDGEASKPTKDDSDVRKAEQTRAISEFETKFKLTEMPTEKRADLNKKIANELSELADPGGTKSVAQIIADTPVNLLPKYLEKAYWLAQKDALLSGDSSIQDFASIGGMSASSGKSEASDDALTEHELKIAEKLRVDPKKYAKSKKDIRG